MTGETIAGRYRLLEPLGRGAMSAVWLAHDDELERKVAVKMLAPSADRARFEREARAAASLSHPNICALYDYGETDGRPYMVLEYLPNGSLEEHLPAGRPLPDSETLRIATAVAAGLAHAHDRGLVHRDLKPANILFDSEERPKIADFGIARMGTSGTLTEAGTVLGTASYISPEQASGHTAGPASDVYSFGVILFRMLTGAFPFVSTNAMELVRMHRDDPPRTVAELRPDAPAGLASIVAASLAKDPAARPADGGALLRELRGGGEAATTLLAPGAVPSAEATQVLRLRPAKPRRRRPVVPIAALAALLLIAGGALAFVLSHHSSGGTSTSTAGLTLPNVPSTASTTTPTTTTTASTTAPTTPAPTTTHRVTTAPVTTAPLPTTAPATTAPPPPTTTAPPPTTTATTTAVTTTTTAPTTTAVGTTTTTPTTPTTPAP